MLPNTDYVQSPTIAPSSKTFLVPRLNRLVRDASLPADSLTWISRTWWYTGSGFEMVATNSTMYIVAWCPIVR